MSNDPFHEFQGFNIEIEDRRPVIVETGAFDEIEDEYEGEGGSSAFMSDQERDAEIMQEGSVGPSGEKLDDMDKQWQTDALRDAEFNKIAPYVNINPPSWNSGVLGGFAVAKPNSDTTLAGPEASVVYWVGEDRESRPVTVTVRPEPLPTPSAISPVVVQRPLAKITFGTKNGQFDVIVDVGSGVQLTVCCSTIYVSVYLEHGSNTELTLYGALGFYAVNPRNPVTRTDYFDDVLSSSAGATSTRALFSNTIIGFERSDVSVQVVLTFRNAADENIGQRVILANQYIGQPIVLPNDVVEIDITADGTIDNARMIYLIT